MPEKKDRGFRVVTLINGRPQEAGTGHSTTIRPGDMVIRPEDGSVYQVGRKGPVEVTESPLPNRLPKSGSPIVG